MNKQDYLITYVDPLKFRSIVPKNYVIKIRSNKVDRGFRILRKHSRKGANPLCLNQLTTKSTLVTISTTEFLVVSTKLLDKCHRGIDESRRAAITDSFSGGHCALGMTSPMTLTRSRARGPPRTPRLAPRRFARMKYVAVKTRVFTVCPSSL